MIRKVDKKMKNLNVRIQNIIRNQVKKVSRETRDAHWDSYNDSHYHDTYQDRYDDYGDSMYHDAYRDASLTVLENIKSKSNLQKVLKK